MATGCVARTAATKTCATIGVTIGAATTCATIGVTIGAATTGGASTGRIGTTGGGAAALIAEAGGSAALRGAANMTDMRETTALSVSGGGHLRWPLNTTAYSLEWIGIINNLSIQRLPPCQRRRPPLR